MPLHCAPAAGSIHGKYPAMLMLGLALGLSGLTPGMAASPSPGPATASAAAAPVDLSGFWQVDKGQWTVPRDAKLTPRAQAVVQRSAQQMASGKVVAYAARWCNFAGVPFLMGQSPPINIVQGSDEILILPEQIGAARHIYMDGRPHPAHVVPTTDGHSIGHWQGDVLVVDTTGFSDNGLVGIPGGGYRTPTSHLVERFRLLDDHGQRMQIESTWDDPNVFTAPHTYSSSYQKLPSDAFAYEDLCDASDAAPYINSGGTRAIHDP